MNDSDFETLSDSLSELLDIYHIHYLRRLLFLLLSTLFVPHFSLISSSSSSSSSIFSS